MNAHEIKVLTYEGPEPEFDGPYRGASLRINDKMTPEAKAEHALLLLRELVEALRDAGVGIGVTATVLPCAEVMI